MAPKKKTRKVRDTTIVEDFEQKPNNETVADGEAIDHDRLEEWADQQAAAGAQNAGMTQDFSPSSRANPYVPEEFQGMQMASKVFGPPQYGSPDPTTAAATLAPLGEHALDADKLPEGHPAAISEDYAANTGTEDAPGVLTSHPGEPSRSDLERHTSGALANDQADATDAARDAAAENNVNLADVTGTGEEGRITKGDVEDYVANRENA